MGTNGTRRGKTQKIGSVVNSNESIRKPIYAFYILRVENSQRNMSKKEMAKKRGEKKGMAKVRYKKAPVRAKVLNWNMEICRGET